MAYPQLMESMAYNRWIYGHIALYEQKTIFVQKHFSVITRPCTCFFTFLHQYGHHDVTSMATMTLGETIRLWIRGCHVVMHFFKPTNADFLGEFSLKRIMSKGFVTLNNFFSGNFHEICVETSYFALVAHKAMFFRQVV